MMRHPNPTLLAALISELGDHSVHSLSPSEWDRLAADAAFQQVSPLLWQKLTNAGLADSVPGQVRRRLEADSTLARFRARAWLAQLGEILDALSAGGVRVVYLKGAHLALHHYGSATVRPMADLDLLVEPEQVRTALEVMVGLGYARPSSQLIASYESHRHLPPLMRAGRHPVELHTTVDPCEAPFGLPLEDVWERAVASEAPLAGGGVLSDEDLLLHLATHMGYSHLLGSSFVRVCDIAVWLHQCGAEADWDAVVSRSVTARIQRFVYTALELSRRLLHCRVPGSVLADLRTAADDSAVEAALELLVHPREILPDMLLLSRPGMSVRDAVQRVTTSLLIPPVTVGWMSTGALDERELLARRNRHRRRWQTVLRVGSRPAAARDALRGLGRVRHLWTWARGQTGST